jgi:hypothetical protein
MNVSIIGGDYFGWLAAFSNKTNTAVWSFWWRWDEGGYIERNQEVYVDFAAWERT